MSHHVADDAHAILIVDQAGWHMSNNLVVPANITILPLPPKSLQPRLISHREGVLAKRKAMLLAKAERTVEGLSNGVGQIVTLFEPQKCASYFKS